MLGWRRSGVSPSPSAGAGEVVPNGSAAKTSSPQKKAPNPSRTAWA